MFFIFTNFVSFRWIIKALEIFVSSVNIKEYDSIKKQISKSLNMINKLHVLKIP